MAYIAKEIRWYKETTVGVKPASPNNHVLASTEGFGVVENQKSEEVVLLGSNGEASGKSYGSSEFSGDIPIVLTGDMMPLILHHAIGEGTKTAATADVWTTITVYVAGDLANHSNGTNTLVCLTGGTADVTEPVITTEVEYDTITDGTVVWILRDTLNKYTGEREPCLDSFGLELLISGDCDGASDVFERTGGCYINTIEFGKAGGDISLKTSLGIIGTNSDNSITNASYEAQAGTDIAMSKEFFGNCDLEVQLDGVTAVNITSLKTPINRNITTEDTLECGVNIASIGTIGVDGSISGLFSTDLYEKGVDHTNHELKLIYTHKGDTVTITYPQIVFDKSPIKVEAQKNAMIDGKFTAVGSSTTASVNYECISSTNY